MPIKIKKPSIISFPLASLKLLYSGKRGQKQTIVFEADVNTLKTVNEPNTIDEMVAEARLEYYSGKTKGFTDTKKLMANLEL